MGQQSNLNDGALELLIYIYDSQINHAAKEVRCDGDTTVCRGGDWKPRKFRPSMAEDCDSEIQELTKGGFIKEPHHSTYQIFGKSYCITEKGRDLVEGFLGQSTIPEWATEILEGRGIIG